MQPTNTLQDKISHNFETTSTFHTLSPLGKRHHYITESHNESYIECKDINIDTLFVAGRFSLGTKIAETLQGSIWRAIDSQTNDKVIIKKAFKTLIKNGKSRDKHNVYEDFLKERGLLLYLSKQKDFPNTIIKVIDSWDDKHCYYYAMEKCQISLFDFVSKHFSDKKCIKFIENESKKDQCVMRLPSDWIQKVAYIFEQICNATQYLHDYKICHLDLSLENVMIYDFNTLHIKLIDFGLARVYDGNLFKGAVGKSKYMAPETYNNQRYDGKLADVYCLGVTLFMMLIGLEPYQMPFYTIENNKESGDKNFRDIVANGNIESNLGMHCRLRLVTAQILDLLHNMLAYEEYRMALEDVVAHDFFDVLCDDSDSGSEDRQLQPNTYGNVVLCNSYNITDLDGRGKDNLNMRGRDLFKDRKERDRSRSRSRSRNRHK